MKRARIPTMKSGIPTMDTRTVPMPPSEKKVESHYNTPEHKEWALKVKQRAGWRCEHVENGVRCSNRHPTSVMYADHIVEIKDNPALKLDLNNGRCLCNPHNTSKGLQARGNRMAEKY